MHLCLSGPNQEVVHLIYWVALNLESFDCFLAMIDASCKLCFTSIMWILDCQVSFENIGEDPCCNPSPPLCEAYIVLSLNIAFRTVLLVK